LSCKAGFWPRLPGNQHDAYNSNRETTAGHRLLGRNTTQHQPCFFQPKDGNDDRANSGVLQRAGVFKRKCLLVIHVQDHATDVPSQFVEVRFSLPCNTAPEWITHKPSPQKFRLTRDQGSDAVLKEFMDCCAESPSGHTSEPCPQIAMWKRVPGAEVDKLPFGQRVPSYRSVDLPLAPVV
jgi:hypothetical protein